MTKRPEEEREHKGRTDLPPQRVPTYEGHSGTEKEVVREEQAPEEEASRRARQEDAAGGDREIA
jgi:hypothetical protein